MRILLPVVVLLWPATGFGTEAAGIVEQLQQGLIETDGRLSDAPFPDRYAAFSPLIEATHDLAFMARVTLSRTWKTLDPDQQSRFVQRFRELSVTSYAVRFRAMSKDHFEILGRRDTSRGRVEIQTRLVPAAGDPVALNYILHETAAGWRIINVLAEGVSDLALKRSQYQQIFKTGGFEQLMSHLQEQIDTLAASCDNGPGPPTGNSGGRGCN